ncbi:uncharacterized protein LOC135149184 [Daucus carota subsp. sativus]
MKKKSNPRFVGMDNKRIARLSDNAGIDNPLFDRAAKTAREMDNSSVFVQNPGCDDEELVDASIVDDDLLKQQHGEDTPVVGDEAPGVYGASRDPNAVGSDGQSQKDQAQERENNGSVLKKSWTEVLKPKTAFKRMEFEYHCPEVVDGKIIIKPPLSVDIQGRKAWENCLVGYFFENRVAFHVMEYTAKRRWSNCGLTDVIMNEEGFFFFKYATEEDLLGILEEGVCMVNGKPFILQRWYRQIVLAQDVPKTIPLWVKNFNVPLQYWNKVGLSRIGSGVGNILMADGLTEKVCKEGTGRLSFAKLLIEVDANKQLPETLYVHIPSDDFMEPVEVSLRVEYPWRPSWCSHCSMFGHSVHDCLILAAIQVAADKEGIVKKARNGESEDFIKVQRKVKAKIGGNHSADVRNFNQAGGVGRGNWKRKGEGKKYGSQQWKGESSGVKSMPPPKDNIGLVQRNKISVLASSNVIDNLERVSVAVPQGKVKPIKRSGQDGNPV